MEIDYQKLQTLNTWVANHLERARVAPNRIIERKHKDLARKYLKELEEALIGIKTNGPNLCCEITL